MFIQSTHRLEFRVNGESFTSAGNGVKEKAPDWITEDEYFQQNEAEGKIFDLAKLANQETEPEDILIDGISIYSWEFPAVNYAAAVSDELYDAILEAFAEQALDISDPNKVTLIGGTYVRNAALQVIALEVAKQAAQDDEDEGEKADDEEQETAESAPGSLPESPNVGTFAEAALADRGSTDNPPEVATDSSEPVKTEAAPTVDATAADTTPSEKTSEELESAGTEEGSKLTVKALGEKIGMTVSLTIGLLRSEFDFKAANGSTELTQELFDQVLEKYPPKTE